jgi:plastocyanin
MRWKRLLGILASVGLFTTLQPATVSLAQGPQTFVIGVDHFDPANQQFDANGPLPGGKLFEYTDFFTRSVQVHSGDVLDFRVAIPDHLIQVTPGPEALSRQQFPLFAPDEENALGSGGPKVLLGPPVLAELGPGGLQTCGGTANQSCDPGTGFAVTSFPNGPTSDWFVAINASPGATFNYFCHLHPGMRGTVTVVDSGTPIQSQAGLNTAADAQFAADKTEGEAAYANAQVPSYSGGAPGSRTYLVHAGLTTSDRHVAIHDMLPDKLNLVSGDVVKYDIQFNVIHTVSFLAGPGLRSPFGVDTCKGYVPLNAPPPPFPPCTEFENGPTGNPGPEIIVDPGTRASGTGLNMQQGANSGVLLGADYGPFYGNFGASSWSVAAAQPGTYAYQCTIHDWMTGTLQVSGT